MIDRYFIVNSIDDAISLVSRYSEESKIIAGGTDLYLEMERGGHKNIHTLIDISRVGGLDEIFMDEDRVIHIGAMVTHSACISSPLIQQNANCLYEACANIGSPQIRNRGTITGNIATASPANDTISALTVLDAKITIRSKNGERVVGINKFFNGVRKTALLPGEIITEINFKAPEKDERSAFIKVALRNSQAISIVNVAIKIKMENTKVTKAQIALGAVSPTIIRAVEAEEYLIGKELKDEVMIKAGKLAEKAATPISDIRSTEKYRRNMVAVHVKRVIEQAINQKEVSFIHPVRLWGNGQRANTPLTENTVELNQQSTIRTKINGIEYSFKNVLNKSLLHLLRDSALLTGTKEGCGEGECGACTIFMDGITVLACLIPSARAHGAEITTIEGISLDGKLHKVQQSFVDEGAVQCGYCTPGFVMSAVKLLEENQQPTELEIKTGISGNLCRCTGYYKIIMAIEKAAEKD